MNKWVMNLISRHSYGMLPKRKMCTWDVCSELSSKITCIWYLSMIENRSDIVLFMSPSTIASLPMSRRTSSPSCCSRKTSALITLVNWWIRILPFSGFGTSSLHKTESSFSSRVPSLRSVSIFSMLSPTLLSWTLAHFVRVRFWISW